MRMRTILHLTAWLCIPVCLFAQTASTGSVLGIVKDPSGAVIPGANLAMLDEATNQSLTTVTNALGLYTFVGVQPGTYRITVSAPGFRQSAVQKLKVEVAKSYNLDIVLEVGELAETVTVTAGSIAELQTVDSTVGAVLSGDSLLRLPTINRSAAALLTIQPLVTPSRGYGTNYAGQVAGMRSDQNRFNLDGVDATDLTSGTGGYFSGSIDWSGPTPSIPVPLESIEEFRVSTTNSNATFRGASGGQISMVTKRGTNDLHGSAYWYHQNDNMNANRWEYNRTGIKQPELKDNRFGGSLGGPLMRDRLFLFGNWESRRFPRTASVVRTVPSATLKAGQLRFYDNAGVVQTYDIKQWDPRGIGISPVVSALWAKFPAGNDPGVGDGLNTMGFRGPADATIRMDFLVSRLDWNISNNWRLNTTYRYSTHDAVDTTQVDIAGLTGGSPGQVRSTGGTPVEPRFWSASLTANFRPTLINEINIGYRRNWWAYRRVNPFPQVPGTSAALMVAQGTLDSGIDVDTQRARSRIWRDNTYSITDNATWIRGGHTIQFGGTYSYYKIFHERDDKVIGSLTSLVYELNSGSFASITSASRPGAIRTQDTGRWDILYAAATGMVDKAGVVVTRDGDLNDYPIGTPMRVFGSFHAFELYLNDVWRLRPEFNLTLGLTYNLQTPPVDANGAQTVLVDAATGREIIARDFLNARVAAAAQGDTLNPTIGYLPIRKAKRDYIYDTDTNNFGPRISAAWNPEFTGGWAGKLFGPKKTVFRGGWGMTFDRVNGVGIIMLPILGVGFSQTVSCLGPTKDGVCAGSSNEFTAFRIGVDGQTVPLPKLAKPAIPVTPDIGGETLSFSIDPKMEIGRSHSFNITIQRELPRRMILEVGYVGRWSRALPQNFQLNSMPLFMKDRASGQTFAQAYDAVAKQLREGTAAANVTAQPWFENQFKGLPQCTPNCTAWLASARSVNFRNNQVNNLINYLNTVRPGGAIYNRQVYDLWIRASGGRANYNGAFVSLSQRFTSGLGYNLNYTFSKTLDQYGLNQENIGVVSTPYDLDVDYGPAIFDRTHVFSAQYNLELPFGRGKRFALPAIADKLLGGWYLSGIFTANSGLPLMAGTSTQTFGGSQAFGGQAAGAYQIDPSKKLANASRHSNVPGSGGVGTNADPAKKGSGINIFSNPETVFKNLRQIEISRDFRHNRNLLRGFPRWNFDQSVGKRTRVSEQVSFVITADFINFFNHVEFSDPGLSLFNPAAFGVVTSQFANPRQFQLGLRVEF